MNKEPKENAYGVKFSEIRAIDLVDMDGDGIRDIVTGKRFWSHGRTGDPDRNRRGRALLVSRGANGSLDFVPYLIDSESGVGTQVVASDLNGDSLPDVVVGNKRDTFVHLHGKKTVTREEWETGPAEALFGFDGHSARGAIIGEPVGSPYRAPPFGITESVIDPAYR
jgi:hypothetical protein